jgi:HEAT repeat protein
LRTGFFVDPDERVRRAAFRAAYTAREDTERAPLLDAARLDPDPEARSLAARAAGAIGGEVAVLSLKDVWSQADDAHRISIVDAWAEPASLSAGGERELSIAVEAHVGLASVSAAYALSRTPGSRAEAGNAWLRRYLVDGSEDEKRLASSVMPLTAANVAALAEAAKTESPELRVIALSRLIHQPAKRASAIVSLRKVVSEKPGSVTEARAHDAALRVLADAGDQSVHATLLADASAKDRATRERAARGLLSLGDYANAAPALADDDVDLRSNLACTLLARADTQG